MTTLAIRNQPRQAESALLAPPPNCLFDDATTWEGHRAAVRLSLKPHTDVEAGLADLIASLTWRLSNLDERPLNFERDFMAIRPGALTEDEISRHDASHLARLLSDLRHWPKHMPIARRDSQALILAAAEECGIDIDTIALPDLPEGMPFDDFDGWEASLLRQAIAAVALAAGRDVAEVVHAAEESAREAADYYDWLISIDNGSSSALLLDEVWLPYASLLESQISDELHARVSEYRVLEAAFRDGRSPSCPE